MSILREMRRFSSDGYSIEGTGIFMGLCGACYGCQRWASKLSVLLWFVKWPGGALAADSLRASVMEACLGGSSVWI